MGKNAADRMPRGGRSVPAALGGDGTGKNPCGGVAAGVCEPWRRRRDSAPLSGRRGGAWTEKE